MFLEVIALCPFRILLFLGIRVVCTGSRRSMCFAFFRMMSWNAEWHTERRVNARKSSVDIEDYCTKRAPPGRMAAVTPAIVRCVSH